MLRPKRWWAIPTRGRRMNNGVKKGILFRSSMTTSKSRRFSMEAYVRGNRKLKKLLDPRRITSIPSTNSCGADPGYVQQQRVTWWPRRTMREKISCRWTSAPPARGFVRSCQLTMRIFITPRRFLLPRNQTRRQAFSESGSAETNPSTQRAARCFRPRRVRRRTSSGSVRRQR